MVLRGTILTPGDIWRYLETFGCPSGSGAAHEISWAEARDAVDSNLDSSQQVPGPGTQASPLTLDLKVSRLSPSPQEPQKVPSGGMKETKAAICLSSLRSQANIIK